MTHSFLKCQREHIYFGMQSGMLRSGKTKHRVVGYLNRNRANRKWVNADVFHRASRSGKLYSLIKLMRKKKVVIVGPKFLKQLKVRTFSIQKFIQCPSSNAYAAYDVIIKAVRSAYVELGDDVIFSFSTGPSAEIIIQDLVAEIPNSYLIDFGSMWDIFCGRRTRKYMSKEKYLDAQIHRNLGLRK